MSHAREGGAPAVPPVPAPQVGYVAQEGAPGATDAGKKGMGSGTVTSKREPGAERETPNHSHSWIWKIGSTQLSGLMRGRDEAGNVKVVHACNLCLPLDEPDPPMCDWKVRAPRDTGFYKMNPTNAGVVQLY